MSAWAPRRFWTEVSVHEAEGGHAVHLDGRPARTPGRRPLVLPTMAAAEAVAAEWQAVEGLVAPAGMPLTRLANTAIEKVAPDLRAVAGIVAAYGATDLLCYRAAGPAALVQRQATWDALLDWAAADLGARLAVTVGVMPVDQPAPALAALGAAVAARDAFALAALHEMVALGGSLVLALATSAGRIEPAEAWRLSCIDADWQAEEWGQDHEAAVSADAKRLDFLAAARFERLCRRVT